MSVVPQFFIFLFSLELLLSFLVRIFWQFGDSYYIDDNTPRGLLESNWKNKILD
jgi:hypothetical protein